MSLPERIVRALLSRPRFFWLMIVLVFGWGVTSFRLMPRQEDPKVVPRYARIVTYYPGAEPQRVEKFVSEPVERGLVSLSEVETISSTSRRGISVVFVELSENVTREECDVIWSRARSRLTEVEKELPRGAGRPQLDEDISKVWTYIFGLSSSTGDARELWSTAGALRDRLVRLSGTADADISGLPEEHYRVSLRPEVLKVHGLTVRSVAAALAARNVFVPGGLVPAGNDFALILPSGEFEDEKDIANAVVAVGHGGKQLRLGDIAVVRRELSDPPDVLARVNGIRAALVAARMRDGERIQNYEGFVRNLVQEFREELPPHMSLTAVVDQPREVAARLKLLFSSLLYGALCIFLIVFFFVGLRMSLVVSLALPLVALAAVAELDAMGFALHQISVAALLMSLGLLIDNAIIISEHIQTKIEEGIEPYDAAATGTAELAAPVLTATLTTVAAFLPVLFMRGKVGEFVRAIPVGMIGALLTSFVAAMTITPFLSGNFLGAGGGGAEARRKYVRKWLRPKIEWTVEHRAAAVPVIICTMLAGYLFLPFLDKEFFPDAERAHFVVNLTLPRGSTTNSTSRAAAKIERWLDTQEEVRNHAVVIGEGLPRFYYNVIQSVSAPRYAQFLVNTFDRDDVDALIRRLRRWASTALPTARVLPKALEQGPPAAPIELSICGEDMGTLIGISKRLQSELAKQPGLAVVYDNAGGRFPGFRLKIDAEAAARLGLSHNDITTSLRSQVDGLAATTVREGDRLIEVQLRQGERSLDDISSFLVTSVDGKVRVPLEEVAGVEPFWTEPAIQRHNLERSVAVIGFPVQGVSSEEVLAGVDLEAFSRSMPPGYRLEVFGKRKERRESFGRILRNGILAVVVIVTILVIEFDSFRAVVLISLMIPLGASGALAGLWLTGSSFGFMALLGIMSLSGIAVNDAILLMDGVKVKRAAGIPLREAVVESALGRVRHIILTSMTTIGGLLPLALLSGRLWAPLAYAIIFGLVATTILTLVLLPALLVIVYGRETPRAGSVP